MKIDMMFPVIKVIDNCQEDRQPRIVGTDSHDTLYLDESTGGIQYLNLQCSEGTKKYPNIPDDDGGFAFSAEFNEWSGCPQIEMVSFEELCEIYLEQTKQSIEDEKKMRAFVRSIMEQHGSMIEEFEDDERGKPCLIRL